MRDLRPLNLRTRKREPRFQSQFAALCKKQFAQNLFSDILVTLWNSINRASYMDTATPGTLTRDEMESRRLLAAQDLQTGLSQSQVARKFGVSRTTASRWNRSLSGKGMEALKKRRAPGRPSRLNADQLIALRELYNAGSRAAGFDSDRWTTAKFAEAILAKFAIRYDPDHAGRIMHRLGLRERRRVRRVTPEVLFTFANPNQEQQEVKQVVA
jgi:transposase